MSGFLARIDPHVVEVQRQCLKQTSCVSMHEVFKVGSELNAHARGIVQVLKVAVSDLFVEASLEPCFRAVQSGALQEIYKRTSGHLPVLSRHALSWQLGLQSQLLLMF